jgi:hypothetical protein
VRTASREYGSPRAFRARDDGVYVIGVIASEGEAGARQSILLIFSKDHSLR